MAVTGICNYLYDHPEGIDPPFKDIYKHVTACEKFLTIEAKAGDTFITHSYLVGVSHRRS